jgi:hypothetical protein
MSDAAPPPTRDLDQAEQDLKTHGLAIVEGVLQGEELKVARDTLYRVAEQDVLRGRVEEAVNSDKGSQRIWNLPSRDPVFCDLVEHPVALRLVKSALGWPVLLSNISANITEPGSGEMMLHADQGAFPGPWDRPHVINIAWCLDDFTEENGATRVVLGSHLENRQVQPGDSAKPTARWKPRPVRSSPSTGGSGTRPGRTAPRPGAGRGFSASIPCRCTCRRRTGGCRSTPPCASSAPTPCCSCWASRETTSTAG